MPDWAASHDTTLTPTARGILEYMLDFGSDAGVTLHELAQVSPVDPVDVIGSAIKELFAAELIHQVGRTERSMRTLWKPTEKARRRL